MSINARDSTLNVHVKSSSIYLNVSKTAVFLLANGYAWTFSKDPWGHLVLTEAKTFLKLQWGIPLKCNCIMCLTVQDKKNMDKGIGGAIPPTYSIKHKKVKNVMLQVSRLYFKCKIIHLKIYQCIVLDIYHIHFVSDWYQFSSSLISIMGLHLLSILCSCCIGHVIYYLSWWSYLTSMRPIHELAITDISSVST